MTDEPRDRGDGTEPPLVTQGTVDLERTHGTNAEIEPALDTDADDLARAAADDVAALASVDERQADDPNAISRGRRRATGGKDDHEPHHQPGADEAAARSAR